MSIFSRPMLCCEVVEQYFAPCQAEPDGKKYYTAKLRARAEAPAELTVASDRPIFQTGSTYTVAITELS